MTTAPPGALAISTRGLTKKFGTRTVVDHLDIAIPARLHALPPGHEAAPRPRRRPAGHPTPVDPRRARQRTRPRRHRRGAPPDALVRRRGHHRLRLQPPARPGRSHLRPPADDPAG